MMSYLTNSPPEFFDSSFVAQSKGREVTRVSSADGGVVKMRFNVSTRKMADYGYAVLGERMVGDSLLDQMSQNQQNHPGQNRNEDSEREKLPMNSPITDPPKAVVSEGLYESSITDIENESQRQRRPNTTQLPELKSESPVTGGRALSRQLSSGQSQIQQQNVNSVFFTRRGEEVVSLQPFDLQHTVPHSEAPQTAQPTMQNQQPQQSPFSSVVSPSFHSSPEIAMQSPQTAPQSQQAQSQPSQMLQSPNTMAAVFNSPMRKHQLTPLTDNQSDEQQQTQQSQQTRISATGRKTTRLAPLNMSPQSESF